MWPACMFAYRRIKSEKGLMKTPKTSIGIRIMYNGIFAYQAMNFRGDQKYATNSLLFLLDW